MSAVTTLEQLRTQRLENAVAAFNQAQRDVDSMRAFLKGFDQYVDRAFQTPRGRRRFLKTIHATIELFDDD